MRGIGSRTEPPPTTARRSESTTTTDVALAYEDGRELGEFDCKAHADLLSLQREQCVLDHLTDEPWLYAVSEALKYERWFPAPATLISFADEYVPPQPALTVGRSPEAIEAARDAARENLKGGAALIRAELQQRGLLASDAPEPVESMPKASA